ncbi:hypothetical protein GCM10010211_31580 [Streptomyces albospinus]|uniref:DUF4229 domain-containing protein n=1 Tax=Streptomyces albospinus TaxID=285515 RepID=A0ABQ2V2D1_9ACTN|nr:hypothetical protein GCM10010211_31580 [Streptomyces albospinus]
MLGARKIAPGAVLDWTETLSVAVEKKVPSVSSPKFATLRYTALRIGLFVACFAVVWVLAFFGIIPLGVGSSNTIWLLLLAIVISAPLSFVLLRKQRDAMSEQIVAKVDRQKERLAANQSMEDGL